MILNISRLVTLFSAGYVQISLTFFSRSRVKVDKVFRNKLSVLNIPNIHAPDSSGTMFVNSAKNSVKTCLKPFM